MMTSLSENEQALQDTIASCAVAYNAAFQILVSTLENDGLLRHGQVAKALAEYLDIAKDTASPLTLRLIDELRSGFFDVQSDG